MDMDIVAPWRYQQMKITNKTKQRNVYLQIIEIQQQHQL